jgi:hypothetical protein
MSAVTKPYLPDISDNKSLPFFLWLISPQLLHLNSSNEADMLPSPSSMFWGDSVSLNALSFLEMSSVALTPASSPDSSISAGLLTSPPSKPTQPRLPQHYGGCLPRPRVNSYFSLAFPYYTARRN